MGMAALAIIVALVVFAVVYVGLGKVLEQHWEDEQDIDEDTSASVGMTWGIKVTENMPKGKIYSTQSGELTPGYVTVYAEGMLKVTGAQTVGSTCSYVIRVVPIGSTDPITATLSMSMATATMQQGAGYWYATLSHQWNSLGYDAFAIPNVGDSRNLECYVYLALTVDGATRTIQSWSTTTGGQKMLDVKHTSDVTAGFTWASGYPEIY